MSKAKKFFVLLLTGVWIIQAVSCSPSDEISSGESEAEQTLEAIYAAETAQVEADAVAAISTLVPTLVPTLAPTNTPVPTETSPNPFTGTWEGIDPYDGSNTTILLVQTGKELLGTYEDSFSMNVKPPGYYGKGSGTISSNATAQLVFDLSLWDGQTGRFDIHLTLSDDNNILTISDCLWNNIKDTEDCPMVMQRK